MHKGVWNAEPGPFQWQSPFSVLGNTSHGTLQSEREAPQKADRPTSIDLSGAMCRDSQCECSLCGRERSWKRSHCFSAHSPPRCQLNSCVAGKHHHLVTLILRWMLIALNISLAGVLIFKTREMWEERADSPPCRRTVTPVCLPACTALLPGLPCPPGSWAGKEREGGPEPLPSVLMCNLGSPLSVTRPENKIAFQNPGETMLT